MFTTETIIALEHLFSQAAVHEKKLTIQLSLSLAEAGQPDSKSTITWDDIDPLFKKDIQHNNMTINEIPAYQKAGRA